jgi:hypothetical protein
VQSGRNFRSWRRNNVNRHECCKHWWLRCSPAALRTGCWNCLMGLFYPQNPYRLYWILKSCWRLKKISVEWFVHSPMFQFFKILAILNFNASYLCYILLVILKLLMLITSTFHQNFDPESGKFDIRLFRCTTNVE